MNESDVVKISQRLCERGLLKCVGIKDARPVYELTTAGRLVLLRMNDTGGLGAVKF